MKRYLGLITLILLPTLGFASGQHNSDKALHYKNQRGSLLDIVLHKKSDNSGTVTGTFKTAVANSNCQNDIGKARPVTGFYTGNSITLSINYPNCGATIAVAGNFDKSNNIETLWIVANQGQDSEGKNWNNRTLGHDQFEIVSQSKVV